MQHEEAKSSGTSEYVQANGSLHSEVPYTSVADRRLSIFYVARICRAFNAGNEGDEDPRVPTE